MFYYSLPIIFKHVKLVTLEEFVVIGIFLLVLLFISSPQASSDISKHNTSPSFYHHLFSAWCGNLPLWRVFWPFFIFLNGSLLFVDYLTKSATFTVSSWDTVHFILIIPIFWWCTSIWRCSSQTSSRLWSAIARLITVAIVAEYIFKLIIRIDYPRVFFNCQELLLDYGGCF